eukprot:1159851-Pelagomonas_calceolata.AAC.13
MVQQCCEAIEDEWYSSAVRPCRIRDAAMLWPSRWKNGAGWPRAHCRGDLDWQSLACLGETRHCICCTHRQQGHVRVGLVCSPKAQHAPNHDV